MKPQEIQELLRKSPILQEAIHKDRKGFYAFLRKEVKSHYDITICVRCRKMDILLETPYRPDLCPVCLLELIEDIKANPTENPYRDKRFKCYDLEYDNECKVWDELDTVYIDYHS